MRPALYANFKVKVGIHFALGNVNVNKIPRPSREDLEIDKSAIASLFCSFHVVDPILLPSARRLQNLRRALHEREVTRSKVGKHSKLVTLTQR